MIVAALVVALGFGGYVARTIVVHRVPDDALDHIDLPAELRLIGEADGGSAFCVSACSAPFRVFFYETVWDEERACAELRRLLHRVADELRTDASYGCGGSFGVMGDLHLFLDAGTSGLPQDIAAKVEADVVVASIYVTKGYP